MNKLIIVVVSFSAGIMFAFIFFACGAKAWDNGDSGYLRSQSMAQEDRSNEIERQQRKLKNDMERLRRNPC